MLELLRGNNTSEIQVGVDEAGRGSLAFGVTAAAVIWDPACTDTRQEWIRDSKRLSLKKRMAARKFIEDTAIAYAVCTISQDIIDQENILQATFNAMHRALDEVCTQKRPHRILVDGNLFRPYHDIAHECIVGGDDKYIAIAAASILAKTYRDEMITETVAHDESLQVYDFQRNKGYGTKTHLTALKQHGVTPYHRKSYAPVKNAYCFPPKTGNIDGVITA